MEFTLQWCQEKVGCSPRRITQDPEPELGSSSGADSFHHKSEGQAGPTSASRSGCAVFWRAKVAVWEGIHLGWSWWTLVGSSRLPRPRQRRRFLSPGTCRASTRLSEPAFPTLQREAPGPADPAGPSLSELLCRAEQQVPSSAGGMRWLAVPPDPLSLLHPVSTQSRWAGPREGPAVAVRCTSPHPSRKGGAVGGAGNTDPGVWSQTTRAQVPDPSTARSCSLGWSASPASVPSADN